MSETRTQSATTAPETPDVAVDEDQPVCPICKTSDVRYRYSMADHKWFRCYGCGIEYPESAVFENRPWVPQY